MKTQLQIGNKQIRLQDVLRKSCKAVLMLFFIILCKESFSQFEIPANQDVPIGNKWVSTRDINNTGADYVVDGQHYSKVMVHDGDTPVFAWEVDLIFSDTSWFYRHIHHQEEVKDPDVVLTNDRTYALVCYERDGEIVLTAWKWLSNPSRFEEQDLLNPNYNLPLHIGYGHNPNIDIEFTDRFVITWEDDDGEIKARAGGYDPVQDAFTISPNIAHVSDATCRTPDVTVYTNLTSRIVTFTYIVVDNTNGDSWVTLQTSFNSVWTNNISNSATNLKTIGVLEEFGRPRIASPIQMDDDLIHNAYDYTVVVDYHFVDGAYEEWQILGYQKNLQVPSGTIIINDDIKEHPNWEPVVAYAGDLGVFSWTAEITYPNTSVITVEVLAKQFYATNLASFPTNYYSIVDYEWEDTPDLPSISGRRSIGSIFYFYKNEFVDRDDMMHKVAIVSAQNLRKSKLTENDVFTFYIDGGNLDILTTSRKYRYFLTDITGKILIFGTDVTGDQKMNIGNLPKGIYLLNCLSETGHKTFKFMN